MLFWMYVLYLRLCGRPEWKVLRALAGVAHILGVPILFRPWEQNSEIHASTDYAWGALYQTFYLDKIIIGEAGGMAAQRVYALAHELGHALYSTSFPNHKEWGRLKQEEAAWIGAMDLILVLGFSLMEGFEAEREKCLKSYYRVFPFETTREKIRQEIPRLNLTPFARSKQQK